MCVFLATLCLLASAGEPARSPILGGQDFRQFYAGTRLLAGGKNPYEESDVWPLQQEDSYANPHVSVSPPPTFLPYLPFGLLGYRAAMRMHAFWSVMLLAASGAGWLRLAGATWRQTALGVLLLWLWLPAGVLVVMGQITALPLFAFTGWLLLERSDRPAMAGALLTLVLVKPHLGLPLALAGLSEMGARRRWRGLAAFAGFALLGLAAPAAFRPTVYHDYLHYLDVAEPTKWVTATLGSLARACFGSEGWWVGLAVAMATAGTAAWMGWRTAATAANGVIVYASMAGLAAAGSLHAFTYDFVLLLPAFLLAALEWQRGGPGRMAFYGWLALSLALLVGKLADEGAEWRFAILPWLGLLLLWRQARRLQAISPPPLPG